MIKISKTKHEFIDDYSYILKKNEIILQLFTTNLKSPNFNLTDTNIFGCIYNDKMEPALLFLNAFPWKLQLFGLNNNSDITKELYEYIIQNNISISGFQGNKEDTSLFYKFCNNSYISLNMDIMELHELTPMRTEGFIKLATINELDFLTNAFINMNKEAIKNDVSLETAIDKCNNMIEKKSTYIYYNKDSIKTSVANLLEKTDNSLTISFVYTFNDFRNKGYANNMINLLCQEALKRTKHISLFVDQTNPISNSVYKKNGFKIISENIEYTIN